MATTIRLFILLAGLAFPFDHPAQSNEDGIQVTPGWKKGQKAGFSTDTSIDMDMEGTPFNSTARSSGTLLIADADAGEFHLVIKPDPIGDLSMEMPTLGDSVNMMMDDAMQMVMSIVEPFTRIGLGFVISRDGEVVDMFNEEELQKAMGDAAKEAMDRIGAGADKAQMDHVMDSIMATNFEAMTAAAVNNMNLFLLGHQCLFPRSGTSRQEVEFHDADAPLSGDDRPTGGHVELKILSRTDRTMVGQVSNIYDKQEFAARMKEQFPDQDITARNIECSEIRTFTFDLKSGWITLITETIEVSFPGMTIRTHNRTTVSLL